MVVRNIELTEEQDRRLEEAASRQGRTVSELLRERIDAVLQEEVETPREEIKRRAASLSGRFRSGLPDLGTAHDRYLEESFRP
jgi:ribbon-helix-helix CopG family protein